MEEELQPPIPPSAPEGTYLMKQLAACNNTARNKALRILTIWLPLQHHISDDDMKKLWKGLFYCVWHADKASVQADLIDRLCSLLVVLDLPLSLHYYSVFLLTMRREWSGIDAHRLDKFYLLIRRFIHSVFLSMKKKGWDLELTNSLVGILEERAFFADDRFLGNGVNYHIASVFLEELKHFLPVRPETLDVMFKSLLSVLGKCQDKVLVGKIKNNVFDVLLKMGKVLLEQKKLGGSVADSGDEVVVFGTIALTMGLSGKFYDLGSASDCFQGNRKLLFSLHYDFLKLEKDLESSGIEISIPEVKVDDEDEVPNLIPVVSNAAEAVDVEEVVSNLISVVTSEAAVGASVVALDAADVAPEGESASAGKHSNKGKKGKKGSYGINKKAKMKKNGLSENCSAVEQIQNVVIANGDSSSNDLSDDGNLIAFNVSVISNLQKQFEKVAAEIGLDNEDTNSGDFPKVTELTVVKKRKRARKMDGQDSCIPDLSGQGDAGGEAAPMSTEKSAKKVRFSMKNNLVWKPQSPLPPQSLRLPPSLTPRGSALKKGIPPGPIREFLSATKKVKQKKKKKARKVIKSISPAIKRMRKLKALPI